MKLSIVSHYYNNETAVRRVLESFRDMAERFPEAFDFVLVDDHSHAPVDRSAFDDVPNLRVFRINEDVPWNMAGARNIGVQEARAEKVFVTDIDHVVHPDDVGGLLDAAEALQPRQKAQMQRLLETADGGTEPVRQVFNCFLMRKDDFLAVGGYEEAFSGHYGYEDKWFKDCCSRNGVSGLQLDVRLLVRRELGTTGLDRDSSHNLAVLESLNSEAKFRSQNRLGYSYERLH